MSRTLWLAFALFILYATTLPFDFVADPEVVARKLDALQWNPLLRADGRRASIPDSVQNVMLFMPFGFLGAVALSRYAQPAWRLVLGVGFLGTLLSLLVESLQLLLPARVASSADLLTNTTGAMIGALLAGHGRRLASWAMQRYHGSRALASPALYPVLLAAALLATTAWEPFDVTLDVSTVGRKVRALVQDPWQSGPLTDEGVGVLFYGLSTVALARWLADLGRTDARRLAGGLMALVAVGLELSQAFISSRMPSGRDAVVRLAGVAAAVVCLPYILRRPRAAGWIWLLTIVTVAGAAVMLLSPFEVAPGPRAFSWLPFRSAYRRDWFPAVSDILEVTLLYVPLGFGLGLRHPVRGVALAATVALGIGLGIEYLQSWVIGRYADVTDVLCSGLGGAVGAWLSTRGAVTFQQTLQTALRVSRPVRPDSSS